MRIIAGRAGGIPLQAPPPPARPTMDRTREALFSSLGEAVLGATVLDLFAGSGSLGLEALSRGAARAVLVENHPACVAVLRRNAAKCQLAPEIFAADVWTYLRSPRAAACFDLIFADPPYRKHPADPDHAARLLGEPTLVHLLAPHGLLILETFAKWTPPDSAVARWSLRLHRVYGDAALRFLAPLP